MKNSYFTCQFGAAINRLGICVVRFAVRRMRCPVENIVGGYMDYVAAMLANRAGPTLFTLSAASLSSSALSTAVYAAQFITVSYLFSFMKIFLRLFHLLYQGYYGPYSPLQESLLSWLDP